MSYSVKELFLTLQGEGAHTGRAAVFCRFSGCNLWNGVQSSRAGAQCRFCDTDFVGTNGAGGGVFASAEKLAEAIAACWGQRKSGRPYVVFTGGEPLLQLDASIVRTLQNRGFEVGVETNGTLPLPCQLDWVCVSPKTASPILRTGDEIKFVYPQETLNPEDFAALNFRNFWIQPMDVPGDSARSAENLQKSIAFCLNHPQWRLSLQTHKLMGIR